MPLTDDELEIIKAALDKATQETVIVVRRLIAEAVAKEREACAQLCYALAGSADHYAEERHIAGHLGDIIRTREASDHGA